MKIFRLGESYYCIMKKKYNLDKIKELYLKKAKVKKGSFAAEYVVTIFNNVFYNAVDLKKDYNDFYTDEYNSFNDFLYHKKLFSRKDIGNFGIHQDQTLLELNLNRNNYNTKTLFEYEDNFIKVFNEMLEGIDI